jgi:cell division protein ZapA
MSDKRHVVRVRIQGEEYTLRTDEDPDHVVEVATYLDRAIQRAAEGGSVIESSRAAILAALQITDELFKVREQMNESEQAMKALSSEIRRWLPPAKRGDASVSGEQVAQAATT